MARRIDFYDDPQAPKPNSLVPSVNVVVANDAGDILLIHRTDNDNWAVPGGAMDLGESLPEALDIDEPTPPKGGDLESMRKLKAAFDDIKRQLTRVIGGHPRYCHWSSMFAAVVPPEKCTRFARHQSTTRASVSRRVPPMSPVVPRKA